MGTSLEAALYSELNKNETINLIRICPPVVIFVLLSNRILLLIYVKYLFHSTFMFGLCHFSFTGI